MVLYLYFQILTVHFQILTSLLVHRKAIVFFTLILHTTTMLYPLIQEFFLLITFVFSTLTIMSPVNKNVLFFLSNLDVLYFLFFLDWTGQAFQYNAKQEWQEWVFFFCSLAQRESIRFLTIKCDMYNRVCLFVLGSNQAEFNDGELGQTTHRPLPNPLTHGP